MNKLWNCQSNWSLLTGHVALVLIICGVNSFANCAPHPKYMVVFINGGTLKWVVYNGKSD